MVQTTYIADHDHRTAQAEQYKSVQSWKKPKTLSLDSALPNQAPQEILTNLERAARGDVDGFNSKLSNAYAPNNLQPKVAKQDAFQFKDVVDVVNPLHHIPIVGSIYREMTNDTIHPVSQIIGGGLYGGPVGAVTGTANAITQVQTGKDISAHAMDLVSFKKKPSYEELDGTTIAMANLSNSIAPQAGPDKITTLSLSPMPY